MGTVACVFSFLLISVRTNFSLFSPCTTTSTSHLLFLRCTQTHPHRKINTEIYLLKKKNLFLRCTQTHPHRKTNIEIYLLKKKKKPKRKNKQTQTEKQKRDRSVLIGTIGACGSRLVGARGSRLVGARGPGS